MSGLSRRRSYESWSRKYLQKEDRGGGGGGGIRRGRRGWRGAAAEREKGCGGHWWPLQNLTEVTVV
jgi:hypothetical protein